MQIPKDLSDQIVEQIVKQEEIEEGVQKITTRLKEKYESELSFQITGTADEMQKELTERYGGMFLVLEKEITKKIQRISDEIAEVYGMVHPLPASCYEYFYAEMSVVIKAFIDSLHEINKKSGLLEKLTENSEKR